jgi:WD repeat-containing protein 11
VEVKSIPKTTEFVIYSSSCYQHIIRIFHRALILYVAAGALPEALDTLRKNQRPDTAALFLLACHEIYLQFSAESEPTDDTLGSEPVPEQTQKLHFLSKDVNDEDLIAVSEVFGQYQQKLIHLCMDTEPTAD